jgi:arabinofuranosyltransferase
VSDEEETRGGIDRGRAALVAGALLFAAVFLKNAWVDEDAYITFRTLEQLFAGNGLRWNPHERVQSFTHPLWLVALGVVRVVIHDPYLAALLLSFGCLLLGAWALGRLFTSGWERALLFVLLLSSRSFMDFTSSGLENPLAYALLAVFLLLLLRPREGESSESPRLLQLTLVFALLLLTRHDLATLVTPAWLVVLWQSRGRGLAPQARSVALGLAPLVAWTAFSLFYYGFALPNTAYAKLGTGIPAGWLWKLGIGYVATVARDDPLTVLVIGAGIAVVVRARHSPAAWALAAGLAANLFYVVRIGGDYMSGRFLGFAFLVAAVSLCAHGRIPRRAWPGVAVAALVYAIVLPGAPIATGPGYAGESTGHERGITDQRGIFFSKTSLFRWLTRDREAPFPDYKWTHEGLAFRKSDERVRVRANVGFMGYWAGTERIIVDRLALTDPLLARLPSIRLFRIGHFPRRIPPGYLETLKSAESAETGRSLIEDAELRAFHEHLRVVTEGPLLAPGRLETILRMNLGQYDHLLHAVPGRGVGAI